MLFTFRSAAEDRALAEPAHTFLLCGDKGKGLIRCSSRNVPGWFCPACLQTGLMHSGLLNAVMLGADNLKIHAAAASLCVHSRFLR